MIMLNLLTWWYTRGWGEFGRLLIDKMRGALSFFSFGALLRTLFAPFRQVAVGEEGRDLTARFQVFLDKLMSRFIGAFVRLILMIAGIAVFLVELVASIVLMLVWPLIPLMPAAGVVMGFTGVAL